MIDNPILETAEILTIHANALTYKLEVDQYGGCMGIVWISMCIVLSDS